MTRTLFTFLVLIFPESSTSPPLHLHFSSIIDNLYLTITSSGWFDLKSSFPNNQKSANLTINASPDYTSVNMSATQPHQRPSTSDFSQKQLDEVAMSKESEISTKECNFCCENVPSNEMTTMNCSKEHSVCHECIRAQCIQSMSDLMIHPGNFCCSGGNLPTGLALEEVLGKEVANEWDETCEAVTNPYQVFCSTPKCWKPLLTKSGDHPNNSANCWKCGRDTCLACRKPSHPGQPCDADNEEEQLTIKLAEERGWKRCVRCRIFIEKISGCELVDCERCGVTFCFNCGLTFSACTCNRESSASIERDGDAQSRRKSF